LRTDIGRVGAEAERVILVVNGDVEFVLITKAAVLIFLGSAAQ